MESLKFNEELESFLANLDFPSCELHPKLRTEFLCLEFDCPRFKLPECSLCFKKLHYETKHPQVEIRTLLTFFLQNQDKILTRSEILKVLPFFDSIEDKLIAIHKRIEELQNARDKIIEMRISINERLANYLQDSGNLAETLGNQSKAKGSLHQFLGYLINSLERAEGAGLTFKSAEFSDTELKTFDSIMDFEHSSLESIIQRKPPATPRPSLYELKYRFDREAISDGVKLLENERVAKREEYSRCEQRFCLVAPEITTSSQITLKIVGLANWIGVGLVRSEFVKQRDLQFLYKLGLFERGHYLVSHKGYSWSDSDDLEHQRATSFEYEGGDVIKISYDIETKMVHFENRSRNKTKSMKVSEYNEDRLAFAVALLAPGDAVEIVG